MMMKRERKKAGRRRFECASIRIGVARARAKGFERRAVVSAGCGRRLRGLGWWEEKVVK